MKPDNPAARETYKFIDVARSQITQLQLYV